MRYYLTLGGADAREIAVDVLSRSDGSLEVTVDGEAVQVDASDAGGATSVRVGEHVFDVWLDAQGEIVRFVAGGIRAEARVESERGRIGARASRPGGGGAGGEVRAPMPGRVVKVLVATGDLVEAGAPVVVVEAMKMENELSAPAAGVVRAVRVEAGQTVDGGATLIELGPLP